MIKKLKQLKKLNDSYLPGKIRNSPVEKKNPSENNSIMVDGYGEYYNYCVEPPDEYKIKGSKYKSIEKRSTELYGLDENESFSS